MKILELDAPENLEELDEEAHDGFMDSLRWLLALNGEQDDESTNIYT